MCDRILFNQVQNNSDYLSKIDLRSIRLIADVLSFLLWTVPCFLLFALKPNDRSSRNILTPFLTFLSYLPNRGGEGGNNDFYTYRPKFENHLTVYVGSFVRRDCCVLFTPPPPPKKKNPIIFDFDKPIRVNLLATKT